MISDMILTSCLKSKEQPATGTADCFFEKVMAISKMKCTSLLTDIKCQEC